MKKEIACPVCNGSGHVLWVNKTENTCSTGSKNCPHCDGTGTRMVDMTNGDRIRAMSDEELAKWINYCSGQCDNRYNSCMRCRLKWLEQPVEY